MSRFSKITTIDFVQKQLYDKGENQSILEIPAPEGFSGKERVNDVSARTVITIARQYGSGGREIGEMLAKKLEIPYYDKELIALAAKKSGLAEEVFRQADERATSTLVYSLVMGTYGFGGGMAGVNEMPINDKLFLIQAEIIRKAAAEGPCVIVGRCADYILREHTDCLRVFIHADRDSRLRRAVEKYGVDPAKVSDFLTKKDKQRANYYNFYTNKKWDALQNYDLTLDSSVFTPEQAVELIIKAAGYIGK